jgi:hypothetical protein
MTISPAPAASGSGGGFLAVHEHAHAIMPNTSDAMSELKSIACLASVAP